MTIKDCLNRAADRYPERVALRWKQGGAWRTRSFGELRERARRVAEMLVYLGVEPGDRVAIFRENSPEWYEIYHGIVGIGAVAVPVDAKLREQEVAHIFHDCGVSVVFCSPRLVEVVLGMGARVHNLRAAVVVDGLSSSLPQEEGVAFHGYAELFDAVAAPADSSANAFGRLHPAEGSLASFIYTSGTTGRQKGAMLTHRNFIANVESIRLLIDFRLDDNILLILPLHHSFAFTTCLLIPVYIPCSVTIVENLKTIKANMAETAPTVLLAVPLLLEKMIERVMEGIESKPLAKWMYRAGLGKVVGRKVKAGLGGALRLVVSGGAPISPVTLTAWNRLGFTIIEGYGITETAPVLSVNPPGAPRPGTVGLPIHGVEIRIAEPNAEGVGEIVVRGENVMQGYYNHPEETAKVLIDGWYHTGDLGYFDEKGYLVISGRKKSLIVNREGKNIYPEEVERQVLESEWVLECLAMGYREPGDAAGERVGLIAVPNQERIDLFEDTEGRRLTEQEVVELVRAEIRKQLDALSDYKRPRRIEVRFEEFEKTSTQKVKRYLYAIDTSRG